MKIKSLVAAVSLGFGVAGAASATPVSDQFFTGNQLLSDNSAEYLVNCTPGAPGCGSTSLTDTTVDIGDRLVGIFDIQTIEQNNVTHTLGIPGDSSNVDELTGQFDAIVTGKTCLGTICQFTFAASGVLGTDIGVILYDDPTPNFDRLLPNTIATSTATAIDGAPWATLSVDFWSATSTLGDNIGNFSLLTAGTKGGQYNVGFSLASNDTGLTFGTVNCVNPADLTSHVVNFCGGGDLVGTSDGGTPPASITPFQALDNVDFTVNVMRVPEPASLALLGIGLLAVAGMSRRRS